MLIRVTGKYGTTFLDLSKLSLAHFNDNLQEPEIRLHFTTGCEATFYADVALRLKEHLDCMDDIALRIYPPEPVVEDSKPVAHPPIEIPFAFLLAMVASAMGVL